MHFRTFLRKQEHGDLNLRRKDKIISRHHRNEDAPLLIKLSLHPVRERSWQWKWTHLGEVEKGPPVGEEQNQEQTLLLGSLSHRTLSQPT